MADTYTTNLNLTKPEPGAAEDTWGISLNADLDSLDAIFGSGGTAVSMGAVTLDGLTVEAASNALIRISDSTSANQRLDLQHNGGVASIISGNNGAYGAIKLQAYNGTDTVDRLSINTSGDATFSGTVTSDGLQVTNTATTGTNQEVASFRTASGGGLVIRSSDLSAANPDSILEPFYGESLKVKTSGNDRLKIANNGDISFYDDSGTSQNLKWDASADSLNFVDNAKATFGTGSDLEIFHTGSYSAIKDIGTGALFIGGDNYIDIGNSGLSQTRARFYDNTVELYSGGQTKLSTTSTGIDVTGEGKFTDLTNGGLVHARGLDASLFLDITSGNNAKIYYDSGDLEFKATNPTAVDSSVSMKIAQNRDISFYDDTGTTQGFFWDSSAESLGIGTTSPVAPLTISGDTTQIRLENTASGGRNWALRTFGSALGIYDHTAGAFRQYIDSSGRVGIGTTSPQELLHISKQVHSAPLLLEIENDGYLSGASAGIKLSAKNTNGGAGYFQIENYQNNLRVLDDGTEKFRIEGTTGNVGIGTSLPSSILDLGSNTNTSQEIRISGGRASFGYDTAKGTSGAVVIQGSANKAIHFENTADTTAMVINSTGKVGIGTDSPSEKLSIEDGDIIVQNDTKVTFGYRGSSASSAFAFRDRFLGVDRFTIDSSGNLLVGKTTTSNATAGAELNASGQIVGTFAGGTHILGRNTNDGSILEFQKDGSIVGSIGTNFGLYIASAGCGLRLHDTGTKMFPTNSAGAPADGTVDLGAVGGRFKDLYLSNYVYCGKSTAAAFNTTVGTALDGVNGYISTARSGGPAGYFNRITSDGDVIQFLKNGSSVGSVSVTSSATAYNTSSDARLKDVTGEARGLEVITKLNPVAYNWKADGKADEGLIAQEVKELVPNAVTGSEDEHYQMDYSKLVTHLVKGMKEQQEQIEFLKEEIANLKGE